ncbi:MAG TPA: LysR family transcriptional regulator [Kofleriaceae bacterium]|nr:LysR family transcriptional regulator [Kofleriaceae bacterium]
MNRAARVRALWDYLPAFRAVAETEHLPTASRAIGVSPPALSRAIHLLEDRLGRPLFERTGARLHLNAAGQALLGSTRAAMRLLDEVVDEVIDGPGVVRGELRVALVPEAGPLFAAWSAALDARAPELSIREVASRDIAGDLRRGELDLALVTDPPRDETLSSVGAGRVTWSLFRGRGVRAPRSPWRLILAREAPWPRDEPCVLAAVVDTLPTAALATARSTGCCTFLPEPLARAHGLSRVRGPSATISLYAAHRAAIATHPRTDAALAALRGLKT